MGFPCLNVQWAAGCSRCILGYPVFPPAKERSSRLTTPPCGQRWLSPGASRSPAVFQRRHFGWGTEVCPLRPRQKLLAWSPEVGEGREGVASRGSPALLSFCPKETFTSHVHHGVCFLSRTFHYIDATTFPHKKPTQTIPHSWVDVSKFCPQREGFFSSKTQVY